MSESTEHKRRVFLLSPEFPTFGICGSRGSGKSVLLEFVLEWYHLHGYICLDWFGSIDHENAYWCIPDTVDIGRWEKLETDDSTKVIDYIKNWFNLHDEPDFEVIKTNDTIVTVLSKNFAFRIRLDKALHHGYLYFNPDTPTQRKYEILAYKNQSGERVVYARNPNRRDKDKARLVGYPVLIIRPKSTLLTPTNPLCVCGIPLAEHDSTKTAADAAAKQTKVNRWTCTNKMPLIKSIPDDTPLKEIIELAAREKRICIFNRGFYGDQKDAYRTLARMLKDLPFLILRGSFDRNQCFCIGFREAGQIAPSGLKGMKGDYETATKRELQTYIREARHVRTVLVLDFQRQGDIARSIGSQRDLLMVKKSTKDLMPDDYLWLFDAIEQKRWTARENLDFDNFDAYPAIPRLKKHESYVVFPDRHFERRMHGMAGFRHKKPSDIWALDANCRIEYLDKKELAMSIMETKVQALQSKQQAKDLRLSALKDAKVMRDEGKLNLQQIAIKIGWIGKDGKPSGSALQRALFRAIKQGTI